MGLSPRDFWHPHCSRNSEIPAQTFGCLVFWVVLRCFCAFLHSFSALAFLVISFWAALTFLLLFAYPTPELPTPSYEFHTAFNGAALGIVIGVHQTYQQFHHEHVARVFSPQLPFSALVGRLLLGIPTILFVKFCSKALAKWILPILGYTLGIPIRSTGYLPALKGTGVDKKAGEMKQSGYMQKLLIFSRQTSFDVDTGIRLLQYAGTAWSVVDLVPSVFSHLGL